jgi:O-antigen/teichoic acid export membrane protein
LKDFLKKSFKNFTYNWISSIIHFLLGIFIIKIFGAEGKGQLSLITTSTALIATIWNFGLNNSAVYFISRDEISYQKIIKIYSLNILVGMFIMFLFFLIGENFIKSFIFKDFKTSYNLYLYVLIAFPIVNLILLIKSQLLGLHDTQNYGLITISAPLLGAILSISLLSLFKTNIFNYIYGILIAEALLSFFFIKTIYLSRITNFKQQETDVKSFYLYGFKSYLTILFNNIFRRIDLLIIAVYIDLKTLGLYTIATFFFQATQSIPKSINGLLFSTFSNKNFLKNDKLPIKIFLLMFLSLSSICLILILSGKHIIPFLYGAEFNSAVKPFIVLQISAVFIGSSSIFHIFFSGIGKPQISGYITIISGIIQTSLMLIFVERLGILGISFSILAGSIITFTLRSFLYYFFHFKS